MEKPLTLVLPPKSRLNEVCSEACMQLLNEHFDPVWNEKGRDYTEEELAAMIGSAEVIVTSWGSPKLSDATLALAPNLQMIAHAAGSLKERIPDETFAKGIRVFSAANRIAASVGEYCLSALMSMLRYIPEFNREVHQGRWREIGLKGSELTGQTVGIVSASSTARAFLKLLAPFDVQVKLYDPYLTEEKAVELRVTRASLEEVMRCPIISVHAPKLPATYGMINRSLIQMIPDGAIFINSSRADVLDEEALLEELRLGRFYAALDVFAKEPLAVESPFRGLSNVLLTPHIAGATIQGHLSLMQVVVEDMIRSRKQEPTRYEVTERVWATLA